MRDLLRTFSPLGWASIAGLAFAVVATIILLAAARGRDQGAVARMDTAMSASHAASAANATETIARAAQRDAAGDKLTTENAHAIRSAPGADQRLDPQLNRAGLGSLCRRAAYRGDPECLQHPGPIELPGSGPRR